VYDGSGMCIMATRCGWDGPPYFSEGAYLAQHCTPATRAVKERWCEGLREFAA
jgi:hypothetical protein